MSSCAGPQKIMQDIYSASMSAAKEYDTHLQVPHHCSRIVRPCRSRVAYMPATP